MKHRLTFTVDVEVEADDEVTRAEVDHDAESCITRGFANFSILEFKLRRIGVLETPPVLAPTDLPGFDEYEPQVVLVQRAAKKAM